MANIEGAEICEPQEYFSGFLARVWESDIQHDEIYTLMMKLDGVDVAARWPVMVRNVCSGERLISAVHLALLDVDLNPRTERILGMYSGVFEHDKGSLGFVDLASGVGYEITQSYLKDNEEDDEDDDSLVDADQRSLSG